jgi:hypothetical protein
LWMEVHCGSVSTETGVSRSLNVRYVPDSNRFFRRRE